MQVEDLGLFSGGQCNKAVEDKIALEVYDLFLIYKKELVRCLESKDIVKLSINDESFDKLEDELKKLDLIYLLPKLFAFSEVVSLFGDNRQHKTNHHFTTLNYVVVLTNIVDYLKSLIFESHTVQTDIKNYLLDDEYFKSYDLQFNLFVDKKLEGVLVKHTNYI